jgi:hypothetical protein
VASEKVMKNVLASMWSRDELGPLDCQNNFFSLTSLKVINPEDDNCKVCRKGKHSTLDATQFQKLNPYIRLKLQKSKD